MDEQFKSEAALVRNHLKVLRDGKDGDGKPLVGPETIRGAAEAMGLPAKAIREFRDGRDAALTKPAVKMWAKLIGADALGLTGIEGELGQFQKSYFDRMAAEQSRVARYEQYDIIAATRGEADSASSVWADLVTTGSIGEEARYGGAFEAHPISKNDSLSATLNSIGYRLNKFILPDQKKHQLVKEMAHYGSVFTQVAFDTGEDDKEHVALLHPMDVREMRVLEGATAARMYGRFPPGYSDPSDPFATWPAYKMVHWAHKKFLGDIYGRSIFESGLRAWVQQEAIESSMITMLLERAPQRLKWIVSTKSAQSWEEKQKRLREFAIDKKKVRTVDSSRNHQSQRITPGSGADVFIGRDDKDAVGDAEILEGQNNFSGVTEIMNHFFSKWLSSLGPPKLQLGYEADTMRSVGTELAIIFGRKARRMQMAFIQGLNHLYWLELILMGIDPRKTKYLIFPPSLGTRDELVRAQIVNTHAMTVAALSKAFVPSGKMPSIQWMLKHVMYFDDDALPGVADLVDATPANAKGDTEGDEVDPQAARGGPNAGPAINKGEQAEMVTKLMENERVAGEIRYLHFLLDERAIRRMDVAEIDRRGLMNHGDYRPTFDVDEAAKIMGIRKKLREVA